MSLISQKDFETRAGQDKIVKTIHTLELKIHELDQKVRDLAHRESLLEQEIGGYKAQEK